MYDVVGGFVLIIVMLGWLLFSYIIPQARNNAEIRKRIERDKSMRNHPAGKRLTGR